MKIILFLFVVFVVYPIYFVVMHWFLFHMESKIWEKVLRGDYEHRDWGY